MRGLIVAHVIGILFFTWLFSYVAAPGQLAWWEPWLVSGMAVGVSLWPWWEGVRRDGR